jgi:hypothetical protein
LKILSKEEIVDLVHKAKCGKLNGLDTKEMSKEDLVTHLINSKCPEVHSMIQEKIEVRDDLGSFLEKFIKDGQVITKENIYYEASTIWINYMLLDAVKNNRYDCIVLPKVGAHYNSSGYSFDFEFFPQSNYYVTDTKDPEYKPHRHAKNFSMKPHQDINDILYSIITQIKQCIDKGVKMIVIPYAVFAHQNLLIYNVDRNVFIRFEPHGEKFGWSDIKEKGYYKNKEKLDALKVKRDKLRKVKEDLDKLREQYKPLYEQWSKLDQGEKKSKLAKKLVDMKEKIDKTNNIKEQINEINNERYKLMENTYIDINLDTQLNKSLEQIFTKDIYKKNMPKFPAGVKYETPNLYFEAEKGFQDIEGKQADKLLSKEEYKKQIGGFCVLWSAFYLNVMLHFPSISLKEVNQICYDYLMKKGERGFLDVILGYLQDMIKVVKKYVKEFDMKNLNRDSPQYRDTIVKLEDVIYKYYKKKVYNVD